MSSLLNLINKQTPAQEDEAAKIKQALKEQIKAAKGQPAQQTAAPVSVEFAQHETQPDGVDGEVVEQYRAQLAQIRAGFGSNQDMMSKAIYSIMHFIRNNPQLKDNIGPDDIGTLVSQLENVAGTIVRGKKKSGEGRAQSKASSTKVERDVAGMMDGIFE